MPDRYGDQVEPPEPDEQQYMPPPREYEIKALAIAACELCDDDGYRGCHPCDHVDRTETVRRGMAAVRAALERGGA